jgi:hypothetical protein
MEFGTGGEFSLIGGFDPLFPVPPGAMTIEVIANVGRADRRHKWEYSTNFLIFAVAWNPLDNEPKSGKVIRLPA